MTSEVLCVHMMDVCMDGWMDVWMDGWMCGCVDVWMDGCMGHVFTEVSFIS